jgi:phage-related protein
MVKGGEKGISEIPARCAVGDGDRAASGGAREKTDTAKPMKGLGRGVFEIALPYRGDAYRAIYAVRIDADIWVVDAFKKKSRQGIKTPKEDIDRIKSRLKKVREKLK